MQYVELSYKRENEWMRTAREDVGGNSITDGGAYNSAKSHGK